MSVDNETSTAVPAYDCESCDGAGCVVCLSEADTYDGEGDFDVRIAMQLELL